MEDIKIGRLGWAGHIIRMEEERIPKKVLNGNFYTTRPVGRPRIRWADVVQRDALQLLRIRRRRRRAEIGYECWRLMREAKARKNCSAIYGWMKIMNRLLPPSNLFESPYLVQMAKTYAIFFFEAMVATLTLLVS